MIKIGNLWDEILEEEFEKEYFVELMKFIDREYETKKIYPLRKNIFKALQLTDYEDVKVVILGQDPYHEENQANGLAFSVDEGVKLPPSLKNIFKELNSDLGLSLGKSGNLQKWAERGVLLLNTVLTVREGEANSHKNKGWEIFTDRIIRALNEREGSLVFILWGNPSKKKKSLISNKNHLIIEGSHPSPLSAYRGFFGVRYFSRVNEFLDEPIDWSI